MIQVVKYSREEKDNWDKFISESKNGVFQLYRDYMDYHQDRFIDHSLVVLKKNKIVAVFPANENGRDIISHGGLTFGSLILGYDTRGNEVLEIFEMIISYYKNLEFKTILYKCIPSIFHNYPAQEDLYALFRNNAKLVRRDISSAIEIENKLKFSESKKQAVTKCVNQEVLVTESLDFAVYWSLLEEVLSKFGTKPVHTIEEITKLRDSFPTHIRLFEARKDNELLAGLVIFDFGQVVHTQYMANSQEGRKLGALDFINSELINNVFKDKRYYSFGISTEESGRVLNTGLLQQKEMMGGRAVVNDFYEIELN